MMFRKLFITLVLFFSAAVMKAQPAKDTIPVTGSLPIYDMPQFPGGNDSLKSYIRKNLRWPGPDWDWEGTVYVKFKVDCKGAISEAKVIRGLDSLANKEALRLVNSMPEWMNVDCSKRPESVWYHLPVKFRLE